jgi:flagellar protein FlbT
MALRISLKDGERIVVNGAVIRSFGRSNIGVENKAAILRGREIMDPADATSPAKLLYFKTMLAYIDPDGVEDHQNAIIDVLRQVAATLTSDVGFGHIQRFAENVAQLGYYRALADCRALIAIEASTLLREESAVAA